MSAVRHLTVQPDDDGQRLDRWLKKNVPEIPYGLLQKLLRKGQMRVDGKRAQPDTRLSAGQDIRIPPVQDKPKGKALPAKLTEADIAFMKSLVIYDDGEVIAINKPYDLAVQGGTKTKRHVDGLLEALKDKEGVKPRLVHRLDKETSGVMLLARSAKVAAALGAQFKGRDVRKIYWALVAPCPQMHRGTIRAALIKAEGSKRERMVVDEKDGKKAVTEYTVVENAHDKLAFVAFWPRTGRTHQLRAHAELIGCPIVGDRKYGASQEKIEGLEHARRLHLHAHRIICQHPAKKGFLDIRAPLPRELVKSWQAFGFNPHYKADPFAELD
jgi:23S rRNA pseudouridine955/2504/2580 synthase